jgi:hypothetical protein
MSIVSIPDLEMGLTGEVQQVITAGLLLHSTAGDRRAGSAVVCGPGAGPGCCG